MVGMGTRPTGGTMPVSEAEGYTHAPLPMEELRSADDRETYLCGANVGKVLAYSVDEMTRKTVILGGRPSCPRCYVRTLTLRDAQSELSNKLYEASRLLEELEHAGRVLGNGHHMRQHVCAFGEQLLAERWRDPPATRGPS